MTKVPLAPPDAPVVGIVVPAEPSLPSEVPIVTPEMAKLLLRAQERDKAFAEAKGVAARLRRQIAASTPLAAEEVEILVAYFLDV